MIECEMCDINSKSVNNCVVRSSRCNMGDAKAFVDTKIGEAAIEFKISFVEHLEVSSKRKEPT